MIWFFACLGIFLLTNIEAFSQELTVDKTSSARVAFYNVENLFDVYDDPLTRDEEFTPAGDRYWNNRKFYDKLNKIYKVMMAMSSTSGPPAVVGLSEIENRFVLEKLVNETPLANFGYKIIHYESPDWRGIDVALLYRETQFKPIYSKAIPVHFPFDTASRTRDILYVKGLLLGADTLHIFINHWPSRYGGYLPTVPKRNHAALTLMHVTDSILLSNKNASVLITGDFNDGPEDESISKILNATNPTETKSSDDLYNLMLVKQEDWPKGTLKYQQGWNKFDMFIVSGGMLNKESGLYISENKATIFHAPYLLEEDKTHLGQKPNRTYIGFKYHGGFSDHLPVFVDVKLGGE